MWLGILGVVVCSGILCWHMFSSYQQKKEYEELQAQIIAEETAKIEAELAKTEAEAEASRYTLEEIQSAEFTGEIEVDVSAPEIPEGVLKDVDENPVDFDKLAEINPELYAWIRIPDTNIDYPVAQREGNDQGFYLHHDMNQNPRFSGCIYTENFNNKNFEDPNTVMYGHNMKNGSMFQNLHKFRDEEFFEKNEYIYIYTEDAMRVYQIFSVYPYDDRHIVNSFDWSDPEVLESYLNECLHPRSMEAHVREDAVVDVNTPIITLSTCIGGRPNERLLVQGVLLYKKETK